MKKVVAILLAFALIPWGFGAVFADAALTDIENTPYQAAIENLVEQGVVKGYPDNSFKPEGTITRAEASVILVKAANSNQDVPSTTTGGIFSDVPNSYWGSAYINYAAEKEFIVGYEDGTFRPNDNVSYYEMAAMLVNAAGFQANDLEGEWPDNYYNKAVALGFMDIAMTEGTSFDGNASATRGNVAMMANAALDSIQKANQTPDVNPPEESEQPIPPEEKPDEGSNSNGTVSTGSLADYSGRAYGIITDVSLVLNEDGQTVQLLDFLCGKDVCSLITKEDNTFKGNLNSYGGELFCLKMNNGVVTDVSMDGKSLVGKYYKEYTKNFEKVTEMKNGVVTIVGGDSYTISDDASIYVADTNGSTTDDYKTGTKRSIEAGCEVRLYSITEDSFEFGPIEVVIVNPKS